MNWYGPVSVGEILSRLEDYGFIVLGHPIFQETNEESEDEYLLSDLEKRIIIWLDFINGGVYVFCKDAIIKKVPDGLELVLSKPRYRMYMNDEMNLLYIETRDGVFRYKKIYEGFIEDGFPIRCSKWK